MDDQSELWINEAYDAALKMRNINRDYLDGWVKRGYLKVKDRMIELKPCPFCGSTDLISEPPIDGWTGPGIKCGKCEMYIIADMDGPGVCADQILVEQWNALPRKSQEEKE